MKRYKAISIFLVILCLLPLPFSSAVSAGHEVRPALPALSHVNQEGDPQNQEADPQDQTIPTAESDPNFVDQSTTVGSYRTYLPMLAKPLQPLVYYVSPNGSDSNLGTESKPWRTIQKAANTLQPGNSVMITSGTYYEKVVPKNSGKEGSPITYISEPGATVIIDGTGKSLVYGDGLFNVVGKSYIIINGLTIRNSNQNCISLSGSSSGYINHLTVENITAQNCSRVGILARYTKNLLIENSTINRVDYSSGIGVWRSENATINHNTILNVHYYHELQGAHEEALTISSVKNFEVKFNTVDFTLEDPYSGSSYYKDRLGITVKDSCQNGKVFGNSVKHMSAKGIYIDAETAGTTINGLLMPTLNHINVFQNKVSNGGGIAVAAEDTGGIVEYVKIYNNLVIDTSFVGISILNGHGDGLKKNIEIYNNTVYGAMREGGNGGAGIYVRTENLGSNDSNPPVIIRNNISMFDFPTSGAWVGQIIAMNSYVASMISADHNLVYGPQKCSSEYPGCVEVGGRISASSSSVFINPQSYDFHLKDSSPAIDAGTTIGVVANDYEGVSRPQPSSSAYDIGAFEQH
jgi:hypothetical protein